MIIHVLHNKKLILIYHLFLRQSFQLNAMLSGNLLTTVKLKQQMKLKKIYSETNKLSKEGILYC